MRDAKNCNQVLANPDIKQKAIQRRSAEAVQVQVLSALQCSVVEPAFHKVWFLV